MKWKWKSDIVELLLTQHFKKDISKRKLWLFLFDTLSYILKSLIFVFSFLQTPVIDDNDEEQVEEEVPETRIEVEIPRIMTNLGKTLHYVKLPNFLSVETR